MATMAMCIKLDENRTLDALHDAREKLEQADGEVVLDFSSVRRIDPSGLEELARLADRADGKSVKLVLRGVNIDVYRVLKLVKLAPRFSFMS